MFNRRFVDQVRHRLINVLSPSLLAERSPAHRADGVSVFIDYQNLYFLLKNAYRVIPLQIHIPNLIHQLAVENGLVVNEIFLYTGVPDEKLEPKRAHMMSRRIAWFKYLGVTVRTAPMHYATISGRTTSMERGIDVMLASELMNRVNDGVSRVMLISQDKGFSQSLIIASEVAMSKGKVLEAFSIRTSGVDLDDLKARGIGHDGLFMTRALPLHVDLVRDHIMVRDEPATQQG
ncbi:NYN domain-containing protein [Hydrogenophaga sp. 2FB]|uniref:NYN domain-containing protein n=1 Tax=Hydrogenophaga sp. 2FB TaxID=2502187 RepID=UPI0014859917|nr:NYN domain-containing protein [Hydrogenophaga sp. 2FB]